MKRPDFPLSAEMLDAILLLMRITEDRMRSALHDHFIHGEAQSAVAARYGYKRQQVGVHVIAIRKKLKPAFDTYAACVVRDLKKKPAPSN